MNGCGYGQPDINNGGKGTAGARSVTVIFAGAPSITVGSGEGVAVPAGSTLALRSRSTPTTVTT